MALDVKALIAKQREKMAITKAWAVDVVCGGEKVTVGIDRCDPDTWDDLVAAHPPRPGVEGDATIGYNVKAVSAAYPGVTLNGEAQTAADWAEFFSVLESVHRNNIGTVIWGANVNDPLQELRELGKSPAGGK